ncbi:DUF1156 domain-containing protein [Microcoleus sp. T2B6]|uniref:DUF1156 domain-containing protein n=1 Tax=Microcoleus sp. T2B6 TaxID=3055424 RepID=UPI002FD00458
MTDTPRLIEVAFPLRQVSLDSVHEKNVRHGHISTLHIWPARRPLAACRAALIATLLPDPGNKAERDEILLRLAGTIKETTVEKKLANGKVKQTIKEETVGGILHWGQESSEDLEWFRQKIREAYGGRVPKVLDPFAGGGAIPLEAMRLGCEVTAIDINPVAWFILKCTLEYPQKLAGQKLPLPDFALADKEFMESYFKAQGLKGASLKRQLEKLNLDKDKEKITGWDEAAAYVESSVTIEADLAWHVRAWGLWVLNQARKDLANFYPTYAEIEPLKTGRKSFVVGTEVPLEDGASVLTTSLKKVLLLEDGTLDLVKLNQEFDQEYLATATNPRWIPKPTVAYLWARTVKCKSCRAIAPLLKTRWLCKKDKKRVLLTMEPNAEKNGLVFAIKNDVPIVGGNEAQKKAHDLKIGAGTMSKSGATCPCCNSIMTMQDIRLEGCAGQLGEVMTAVVVDGQNGKEYRLPTSEEFQVAAEAEKELEGVFSEIPFGLPEEPTPLPAGSKQNSCSLRIYGLLEWKDIFIYRQLLVLGTFSKHTRSTAKLIKTNNYSGDWIEALLAYLSLAIDRVANRSSCQCIWNIKSSVIEQTFSRFALPILWDFAEANPLGGASGNYAGEIEWISLVCSHITQTAARKINPNVILQSSQSISFGDIDVIITDPPYYDAISYSDLMDFFYIWIRRSIYGVSQEIDSAFREKLAPKWDYDKNDGELIDNPTRFDGNKEKAKAIYEDGMFKVFQSCYKSLTPEGRLVIVFAHKHPDAWETLVSAIIRAGFIVDGSWPIQTERSGRMRANASAALSSSVWLVCKKRPQTARPGWDNKVLDEMRSNITDKLRRFWDDGIRGPDFVWAATGPAMESYSKYPVVKKANDPGKVLTVSEFLSQVRRLVLDFVVGRFLSETGGDENASGLDDITTYYLLHRHDFGIEEAPIGACILYAVSCGLSDKDLASQFDLFASSAKSKTVEEEEDEDEDEDEDRETDDGDTDTGKGSKVKLKPWQQRKRKSMGYEGYGTRPIPLIDKIHCIMHLWKAGDVSKVDDYADSQGLRRNALFNQVLQALIELAKVGSDERALLESISNHITTLGGTDQLSLF